MFEVENIINENVKKYVKSELKNFDWLRVDVINLSQGITIIDKVNGMSLIILNFFDYIVINTNNDFTFFEYRKGIDNEFHYFAVSPELIF